MLTRCRLAGFIELLPPQGHRHAELVWVEDSREHQVAVQVDHEYLGRCRRNGNPVVQGIGTSWDYYASGVAVSGQDSRIRGLSDDCVC